MRKKSSHRRASRHHGMLVPLTYVAIGVGLVLVFVMFYVWRSEPESSSAAEAVNYTAPSGKSPYGAYPNCIAPGVPLEVHSWWHQNGEILPRHLHLATCAPNAHDTTGAQVSMSSPQIITTRIISFNNPGTLNWARYSWESTVIQKYPTALRCETSPDERKECSWWIDMTIDPSKASYGGLHELRLSPNMQHSDLQTRQFATLNYQIYLNNGKPAQNYRSTPAPIGRSWYDLGFGYANAQIDNYTDFFKNGSETIPTVSGVVKLKVKHSQGNSSTISYLFLDPDFHQHPEFHENPDPNNLLGAKMLYKKAGLFSGTVDWDTRTVANGRHILYIQTEAHGSQGLNAGAIKYFMNVQN